MKNVLFGVIGILAMMVFAAPSVSDTKYNAFTGEWENTTVDGVIDYNPFSGTWSYVPGSDANAKSVDNCPSDCTGSIPDLGEPKAVRNKNRSAGSSNAKQVRVGTVPDRPGP